MIVGRRGLLLAVAVAASGVAVAAEASHVLDRIEVGAFDARLAIGGPSARLGNLAVVAIDVKTQQELHQVFPFDRRLHARMIDRLRRARPAAIAYDVQFTEPKGRAQDIPLIDAVRRAGPKLALATGEVDPGGVTNVLGGDLNLRDLRTRAADSNIPIDADGVMRRMSHSPHGLDTLAVAAVEVAERRQVARSDFPEDRPYINFPGPPGTVKHWSFSDVLRGRVPDSALRNRIVVVGVTDPVVQDVHRTSVSRDELMSGPELQADAINTIQEGFPLGNAGGGTDALLIVLMAAVAPLAGLRLSLKWTVAVGAGALLAFLACNQLAFNAGRVVSVAYPVLGLTLGTAGAAWVKYVTEIRHRRHMRDVFERFVPGQVVQEAITESSEDLRVGGRRLDVTVLFSDLRGFTSFSEHRPAEEVIGLLNEYLGEMSDAIREHGGTVVSYMGDGIMAVFGAPEEQEDHADRAVAAAREMLDRLDEFNARMRDHGQPTDFRMGIGLNSGPVMSGAVGSKRRLEYTTIGDTTNTASRLESMTKETGHPVLIADSTRERLRASRDGEAPELDYVGELPVRGRDVTVKLWSLPSADAQPRGRAM